MSGWRKLRVATLTVRLTPLLRKYLQEITPMPNKRVLAMMNSPPSQHLDKNNFNKAKPYDYIYVH